MPQAVELIRLNVDKSKNKHLMTETEISLFIQIANSGIIDLLFKKLFLTQIVIRFNRIRLTFLVFMNMKLKKKKN